MGKLLIVVLLVVVAVGAFLALAPRGGAASVANAATLAVLRSEVEAQKGGAPFAPAFDGDLFTDGDVVRSQQDGRAVLTFWEGSTITVEPGSDVKVASVARTADGGIQAVVEQSLGRTWMSVTKLGSGSRFEVRTPTMTAVVRGTTFEILVARDATGALTTTLNVDEGTVSVTGRSGGTSEVPAGNGVVVPQNAPAPAPAPQPARARLVAQSTGGLTYALVDPFGRVCGQRGDRVERQIPHCDVQGGSVSVGQVVAGSYGLIAAASQNAADASITLQGLRGQARDLQVTVTRAVTAGQLLRTSVDIAVAPDGRLSSGQFAPVEVATSACGAEARGRVFMSGTLDQRMTELDQLAAVTKGQAVALVVTASDLTASAAAAGSGAPSLVSDVNVTIDTAGLHFAARASVGPVTIPIDADVVASASGGRLMLQVRRLEAGPLPRAVKDQLNAALAASLNEFANDLPYRVDRIAFGQGCMAVIGVTR